MSVIEEPEIRAAITQAKRGFVDAVPTPISYEVFVTRLEKGNIAREAFAGRLTDIPNMGLRFICATCRGPATFDARSKATTCVKAQKPCGLTTAEYTIMPKLEIHPTADGMPPTTVSTSTPLILRLMPPDITAWRIRNLRKSKPISLLYLVRLQNTILPSPVVLIVNWYLLSTAFVFQTVCHPSKI